MSKMKMKRKERNQTTSSASKAWYIMPIVFGIIGGAIAYFVVRKEDRGLASNCIKLGLVMLVIQIVIGYSSSYVYPYEYGFLDDFLNF